MRSLLPLALLLASCSAGPPPIQCDVKGMRLVPRNATPEQRLDAALANLDLQERRARVTYNGEWFTRASLDKAEGCP